MAQILNETALAAALAEQIYRRGSNDLPIKIADLEVVSVNRGDDLAGLKMLEAGADVYYYSTRGFAGRCTVTKDGQLIIQNNRGYGGQAVVAPGARLPPRRSRARLQRHRKVDHKVRTRHQGVCAISTVTTKQRGLR